MSSAVMIELLAQLRGEQNGEVTALMQDRGVKYPLNYGVSTPVIKQIATQYATDDKLAKLLYQQDVRELRIAAYTIADAAKIDATNLTFWTSHINNYEMAEQAASQLFARSKNCMQIISSLLSSNDEMLEYCGLLCASKTDAQIDKNIVEHYIRTHKQSIASARATAAALYRHTSQSDIQSLITVIKNTVNSDCALIANELSIYE